MIRHLRRGDIVRLRPHYRTIADIRIEDDDGRQCPDVFVVRKRNPLYGGIFVDSIPARKAVSGKTWNEGATVWGTYPFELVQPFEKDVYRILLRDYAKKNRKKKCLAAN